MHVVANPRSADSHGCAHRRPRALAIALLLACACLLVPSAASAADPSYVGIGDSYAGMGIPLEGCHSPNDFEHQIASALGLSLTDVSCGGATTSDETKSQAEGVPPQDNALTPTTEVVTVAMGGNDHGLFGTVASTCTQLDATEHVAGKAPCKKRLSGYVSQTYSEDEPADVAAVNHIKLLAPNAKVFLVAYLEITPSTGLCPGRIPWYPGDLSWFHKLEAKGTALERKVAKATGANFVNMFELSAGHNACQGAGERWVEPLIEPLTGVPLHPSVAGVERVALDTEQAMRAAGVL